MDYIIIMLYIFDTMRIYPLCVRPPYRTTGLVLRTCFSSCAVTRTRMRYARNGIICLRNTSVCVCVSKVTSRAQYGKRTIILSDVFEFRRGIVKNFDVCIRRRERRDLKLRREGIHTLCMYILSN